MGTNEKQFWDMLKNSISYGRKNEIMWNGFPIIKTRFEATEAFEMQIAEEFLKQQQSKTEGHTISKRAEIDGLVKSTYRLSRNLAFYAKETHNMILLSAIDFAETDLKQASEVDKFNHFKTIVKNGRDYLEHLENYGVSARVISALESSIAYTEKLPAQVNLVSSDHKMATKAIAQLIVDARKNLDILDDAFEGMVHDETFLDGWFDARKIKGRHQSKKSEMSKELHETLV